MARSRTEAFQQQVASAGRYALAVPGRLLSIPLELLPSPGTTREIAALAGSIAEQGLVEPIRVLRDGAAFIVVDGARRLAAYRWLAETAPTASHAARWRTIDSFVVDREVLR